MMNDLPGQIAKEDDLKRNKNILNQLNDLNQISSRKPFLLDPVPPFQPNITAPQQLVCPDQTMNKADCGWSCVEKETEAEDRNKNINCLNKVDKEKNVSKRPPNDKFLESNNGIKALRVVHNVNTINDKRYIKKSKDLLIQLPPSLMQDTTRNRFAYNSHQDTSSSPEATFITTDDDDEEDNRLMCEGDIGLNVKLEHRDKGSSDNLEERRWAERVFKDTNNQKPKEGIVPRKQYQRGNKSEAATRREMLRLMHNSIVADSLRKHPLHTIKDPEAFDMMDVSSVDSLTWEETTMTSTSDSQEEESNRDASSAEPTLPSPSENSLVSSCDANEVNTPNLQFSIPCRFQYFLDDPDQLDVLAPAQQGSVVKCHIIKYTNGMVRNFCPIYYLYIMNENGVGTFLLAARKRFKCMGSSYVICKDSIDLSRGGSSYVAKLKANLVGTEYRLLCKSYNPEKSHRKRKSESCAKPLNEIAGIIYEYANLLGVSNPETLTVIIPRLNSNQERMELILDSKQDGLIEKWRRSDLDDIMEMPNRKPWINEETNQYELSFYGSRSPEYSFKNFQIMCDEIIALQVGQIDKDLFFMDFKYPLCTLQAFAIALSCFDRK